MQGLCHRFHLTQDWQEAGLWPVHFPNVAAVDRLSTEVGRTARTSVRGSSCTATVFATAVAAVAAVAPAKRLQPIVEPDGSRGLAVG